MAEIKKAFLGFKQVTSTSFEETVDRAGYLWLVRNTETGAGDVWFGNKHYGSYDPSIATDLASLKDIVDGILSDIGYKEDGSLDFVEALAEETTITGALNKLVELINSKDVTYVGKDAVVVDAHEVSLKISADDKVLSQDENGLLASLSLVMDAEADTEGKRYIKLLGKESADLGKIDIAEFVKDGMISGAKLEVEDEVTYLVLSFNTEGVDDIRLDVSKLIDAYLAGDGLVLEGKTFKVALVESEAKANYLVLEDGKLGVFEMGADVTKTTEEILIAGGPLASAATSVFGESIPSGKTVQDILVALFCKEEWPKSLTTTQATLKSSVAAPTITMSTSTVEVGTEVAFTVKNGASSSSSTAATSKTFDYGYSTSNNNVKESANKTVTAPVTNIAIVNSDTTLTVTSTGNDKQTANGTNVAGSAVIEGTILAVNGTNTVAATGTSATYSGECAGLPEYFACSNIKKTSDSYKTAAIAPITFTGTTAVSANGSKSFSGKYCYFIGYYSDSTFADKTYTSESIRVTDKKLNGFMNGTTISTTITVPAGTKGMYIAIPEGVDDSGSNLQVIQTTALNSPVQDEMKNNLRTLENMSCAGSATKNYKIFTWSFPGGTSGSETFAINKF